MTAGGRTRQTAERSRGWGGVSFRGIDVPQYSLDAVDTPICNDPDAISVVACARARASENAPRRILFRPLPAFQGELPAGGPGSPPEEFCRLADLAKCELLRKILTPSSVLYEFRFLLECVGHSSRDKLKIRRLIE